METKFDAQYAYRQAWGTGEVASHCGPDVVAGYVEGVLDALGPCLLLRTLASVAYEKAAHVREAWQDERLARHWERLARRLERLETWPDIR
jgi:hypothetical protein